MKKIMTKTDMKGIHGGGRLKQRIAEHLRASRAVVSMSTAGVAAVDASWMSVRVTLKFQDNFEVCVLPHIFSSVRRRFILAARVLAGAVVD